MRIVCVISDSVYRREKVSEILTKIGYEKIKVVTTGKAKNGRMVVSKEKFSELVKKRMVLELSNKNDVQTGIVKPMGSASNVMIAKPEWYIRLKQEYGTQVIGVYINIIDRGVKDSISKDKYDCLENNVDIEIKNIISSEGIVAEVLKYIKAN